MNKIKHYLILTATVISFLCVNVTSAITIISDSTSDMTSGRIKLDIYSVYDEIGDHAWDYWCWDISWEKQMIWDGYINNGQSIEVGGGISQGDHSKDQYVCIITQRDGYPSGYKGSSKIVKKTADCKIRISESGNDDIITENCLGPKGPR